MRIATSIDWSFLTRFLTKKTKRITLIVAMIVLYVMYSSIEWSHHNQMQTDDFWVTWSWVLAVPAGICWLWGEWKENYWHQILGAILFVFLGPVLSMGSELRNIHIFSEFERNIMLLCLVSGLVFMLFYMKNKFSNQS